jgi:hypothetical protein
VSNRLHQQLPPLPSPPAAPSLSIPPQPSSSLMPLWSGSSLSSPPHSCRGWGRRCCCCGRLHPCLMVVAIIHCRHGPAVTVIAVVVTSLSPSPPLSSLSPRCQLAVDTDADADVVITNFVLVVTSSSQSSPSLGAEQLHRCAINVNVW